MKKRLTPVSSKKKWALVKRSWCELWKTILEIILLSETETDFMEWVEIDEETHEKCVEIRKNGALLLVMHSGNWELLGGVLRKLHLDIHSYFLSSKWNFLNVFLRDLRNKLGIILLDREKPLSTLRVLKKKGLVGIIADQDGGSGGVILSFFQRMVSAPSGIAVLGKKTGAPVYGAFLKRMANGKHRLQLISICQPDELSNLSEEEIMKKCYLQYEKWILSAPSQWLWVYDRFKNRRHLPVNSEIPESELWSYKIYQMLFWGIGIIFLPGLLVYLWKTGKISRLKDFFGMIPAKLQSKINRQKKIWIHAVSVGEINIVIPLIRDLHQLFPEYQFIITTTCQDAELLVKEKISDTIPYFLFFLPLDLRWTIKRFIEKIQPEMVIISETDIWPTFLLEIRKKSIPLIFYNMRVSDKISGFYSWLPQLSRRMMDSATLFLVSDNKTRQNLIDMKADPRKIIHTGNVKASLIPLKKIPLFEKKIGEKFLICGSVHLSDWKFIEKMIKLTNENYRIIIAPRKIENSGVFQRKILGENIQVSLLSEEKNDSPVVIVDKMGILSGIYFQGDIAFIGGGEEKTGIHNILEPVLAEVPVVFGANTRNFSEFADLFQNEGFGFQIKDPEKISVLFNEIINGKSALQKIIKNYIEKNQKSYEKSLNRITGIINELGNQEKR